MIKAYLKMLLAWVGFMCVCFAVAFFYNGAPVVGAIAAAGAWLCFRSAQDETKQEEPAE